MNIVNEIKISALATIVLGSVCCGLYPVVVWGMGQVLFNRQANGSLVYGQDGKVIGSELIGQNFNGSTYFNPRPSAAGTAGYDPTSSGGSNLGPTQKAFIDSVKQRVADYRKANGLSETQLVPADAVTASASGLDPHISVKNALLQLPRVAKERKISEDDVRKVVDQYTDKPDFGIFGESRVNVLMVNLALDGKLK